MLEYPDLRMGPVAERYDENSVCEQHQVTFTVELL
jgi:hypothetical protein